MPEKEVIFNSKIKNSGPVHFKELYRFCYDWLREEANLVVVEEKYVEKLGVDSKNIDIKWSGFRKITDYFKHEIKVEWSVIGLKDIEIEKNGKKSKINTGSIEIKVKGVLIRDYEAKFEQNASKKFMRAIYEKWVIPARVEEYESKLISECDEFLDQVKAYLALEGQKAGIVQI